MADVAGNGDVRSFKTTTKWKDLVNNFIKDRNICDALTVVLDKLYYAGIDGEELLFKLSDDDVTKIGLRIAAKRVDTSMNARRSNSKDEETASNESPRSSISTRAWAAVRRSFRGNHASAKDLGSSARKTSQEEEEEEDTADDTIPPASSPISVTQESEEMETSSEKNGIDSTSFTIRNPLSSSKSAPSIIVSIDPSSSSTSSQPVSRRQRLNSPLSVLTRRESSSGVFSAVPHSVSSPPPPVSHTSGGETAGETPDMRRRTGSNATQSLSSMKEFLKRNNTPEVPLSPLGLERKSSVVGALKDGLPNTGKDGLDASSVLSETHVFANKLSDEITNYILAKLNQNGTHNSTNGTASTTTNLASSSIASSPSLTGMVRSRLGKFTRARSKTELLRLRGGSKDETYSDLDGLPNTANPESGVDRSLFRLNSARVVSKTRTNITSAYIDISELDSFPISLQYDAREKFIEEEDMEIEITASPTDFLIGKALIDKKNASSSSLCGNVIVPLGNHSEALVEWKRSTSSVVVDEKKAERNREYYVWLSVTTSCFLLGSLTSFLGTKILSNTSRNEFEWMGMAGIVFIALLGHSFLYKKYALDDSVNSSVVEITSATLRDSTRSSSTSSSSVTAEIHDASTSSSSTPSSDQLEAEQALRENVLDFYAKNSDQGPGSKASKKRFAQTLKKWGIDPDIDLDSEARKKIIMSFLNSSRTISAVLRARKFNIDAASKLMRTLMEIRTAFSLDENDALTKKGFAGEIMLTSFQYMGAEALLKSIISITNQEEASTYRRTRFMGRDKNNNLIVYQQAGAMDLGAYYRDVCRSEPTNLVKFSLYVLELWRREGLAHAETTKNASSQLTVILDLDGFSLSRLIPASHLLPIVREVFPIVTVAYPELFQRLILINTPYKFTMFHRMLKPFISKELLDKMQVHGRVDVVKILSNYVAPEEIPMYLGGQMVGTLEPFVGDPFCRDRVGHARGFWRSKEEEDDVERRRSLSDSGNERHSYSNGSLLG